ncbi:hypothetical protein FZC66_00575 [Priestia megaterium]|nr:hypothetical protein FZC66_00575 [Priestia megaterium]
MAREFVMGARINLETRGFTNPMRDAIQATQSFRQSVDTGASGMRTFDSSVDRTGSSMSQMARQADTATREMREQAQVTTTLKDRLFSLQGAVAAVAGSMAVKGAYNWLVGANADMEQYQNTLTVVLGSQQKAVEQMAWAEKFAAKTPFEIPSIIDATTRLESYGIESKKVLGITGDMASVMGKDLMQAVEAVADAQTGELERMKEFGITKKMIEDQAKLLGTNPINNKGQITDMKAFNTVMFSLMEERFKGGMEMQSKSFKGMLSNAADFMGSMGRRLGEPLFEKAKAGLGDFLGFLNRLQDSGAIDSFITKTQKVGSVIWNAFSTAGSMIANVFNAIKGPATATIGYLVDNFKTLSPYIFGVAAALGTYAVVTKTVMTVTKAWKAAQLALNVSFLANPIFWIVAGIGLLIGAAIQLAGGWDVVKQKLLALWPVVVNAWNNIWSTLKPILTMIGQKAIEIWQYLVQAVPPLLMQLWTAAVTWLTNIWNAISQILTTIWTGIVNIFNAVKSFWNQWGGLITALFQVYWAYVSSIFKSTLSVLWTLIKGGFTVIYNIVSGIWKMVSGVIQVGWSIISGLFSFWLNVLSGNWQGAWDSMLGMLDGVWSGIKDFFSGLKDLFFDSGAAIMRTLADGIKSMVTAPFDAVKSALGKVRELLPFSDAKTGPLSDLTHNGGKIVSTMAEGVYKQAGTLHRAMSDTFESSPGLSASSSIKEDSVPLSGSRSRNVSSSKSVKFGDIHVHIDGSNNRSVRDMADELIEVLHEKISKADTILSDADWESLLYD